MDHFLGTRTLTMSVFAIFFSQQLDVKQREVTAHQDALEKEKLKGTFLADQLAGAREEIHELQKKLDEELSKQRAWSAAEKCMESAIEASKYGNIPQSGSFMHFRLVSGVLQFPQSHCYNRQFSIVV